MAIKPVHISCRQLYGMVFLLRLCNFITYLPSETSEDVTLLGILSLLLGSLWISLLLIPFYLLLRRYPGEGILECGAHISPLCGRATAALLFAAFLFNTSYTLAQGEIFFTSVIAVGTYPPFILACFAVAAMYAAKLGIQAICRTAMVVLGYFLLTMLLILITLIPYLEPLYLSPVTPAGALANGDYLASGILSGSYQLTLLLLMVPYVKEGAVRGFPKYLLVHFLLMSGLILMKGMVLGDYASVKSYPFYAMVSIARLSFFDRMDALHMVTWLSMTFVKSAILLFFTAQCLRRLLPRRWGGLALPLSSAASLLLAVLFSCRMDIFTAVRALGSSLGLTTALICGLPLAILLLDTLQKQRKRGNADEIA